MGLADQYRQRVREGLLGPSHAPTVEVSDNLVALCFAKDLMQGDTAECKAGYTAENAALAALDIFPDADRDKLAADLGVTL